MIYGKKPRNGQMTKYNVYISEPAEQDLDDIAKYISTQLLAPLTADNMLDEFFDAISGLETMPYRHPLVGDAFLASFGYRVMPVKNYLVIYTVNLPKYSCYPSIALTIARQYRIFDETESIRSKVILCQKLSGPKTLTNVWAASHVWSSARRWR